MLPAWKLFTPRFVAAWIPRWREVGLYALLLMRRALDRPFEKADYHRVEGPRKVRGNPAGEPRLSLLTALKRH